MLVTTLATDKSHDLRAVAKRTWQSLRNQLPESLNFFLDDLQRTSTMAPSPTVGETACNVELAVLFSEDLWMNLAKKSDEAGRASKVSLFAILYQMNGE